MKDLAFEYRTEGDFVLIEMELRHLHQFFNTLDPSPFVEKDIDADAEDYIIDSALEINIRHPMKLVIYLPPDRVKKENPKSVSDAVHHYFAYRARAVRRDLRIVFQQGRWSLFIGFLFLVFCIFLRSFIPLLHLNEIATEILSEGILISGWVAMWRPFQIFVYDWWPIHHQIRVFDKLSSIEVDLRPNQNHKSPAP